MKIVILVTRLLLGLLFLVFGLNHFLHFIPMELPGGAAGEFVAGLVKSKYLMPLLGIFQTLCGLSLLTNRFVPLALVILVPINLNIFLYHVVLAPEGLVMGILVLVMNIFLIYAYRNHFLHLSAAKLDHSHM